MYRRTRVIPILVILFSLAQTLGGSGALAGGSTAYAHAVTTNADTQVRADKKDPKKDKNDNKDQNDNADKNDNEGDCSSVVKSTGMMLKDSKDEKKDKEDTSNANDNEADANDNSADCDSTAGDESTSAMTPATTPISSLPMTEVTGTSTGGDSTVSLIDERVVLRIFPWTPSGITFKMRFVDPATVSAPPGQRVGNMTFQIEAQDASGAALTMLPAEVNLSARYADRDVAGASEQNVTLSRLSPTDNQWHAAPKITRAAENNYIAASIMEPGTYAINIP
jgi:hypothetical protein